MRGRLGTKSVRHCVRHRLGARGAPVPPEPPDARPLPCV